MFLVDDADEAMSYCECVFGARLQYALQRTKPSEWASLLLDKAEIMFWKKECHRMNINTFRRLQGSCELRCVLLRWWYWCPIQPIADKAKVIMEQRINSRIHNSRPIWFCPYVCPSERLNTLISSFSQGMLCEAWCAHNFHRFHHLKRLKWPPLNSEAQKLSWGGEFSLFVPRHAMDITCDSTLRAKYTSGIAERKADVSLPIRSVFEEACKVHYAIVTMRLSHLLSKKQCRS